MAAKAKVRKKRNKKAGETRQRFFTALRIAGRGLAKVWPIGLAAALVFGGGWWLFHSERFALKNLLVNPTHHVEAKRLRGFIDARMGTNLFQIDLEAMQARVKSHHWVKSVRIRRNLPDTLVLTIEEYEPYAMINLEHFYYVNEDGFLFKRLEQGESRDYPVLSGFSTSDFQSDSPVAERNVERLRTAVALIRTVDRFSSMDSRKISEVRFDLLTGFSLVLEPNGTEIRLGTDNFEKKLNRFQTIYDSLGARASNLTLVDLVNPDQAVIKGLRKVNAG